MGIDVVWTTESGERMREVLDPQGYLTDLSTWRWNMLGNTKCVQFIDPWGDTVFNQAQLPVLKEELAAELAESSEEEVRGHLEEVILLVGRALGETHTFIRFVGD